MTCRPLALAGLLALAGCLDAPPEATVTGGDAGGGDAAPGGGDGGGPTVPLLAAFRFDSGADFFADSSGNGNDAVCADIQCPIPTIDRFGGAGQAALFDGEDDFLGVGSLGSGGPFTVQLWLRLDQAPAGPSCAVSKPVGANVANSWQLCLEVEAAGSANVLFYTSVEPKQLFDTVEMQIGTWHHAAIRWDGSQKTIWWDGSLVALVDGAITEFDGSAIRIGADLDGESGLDYFIGALDDIEIYDGALSDGNIRTAAGL